MKFAHAGICEACVADDLLFARAAGSGRIFFVCAACYAAGTEPPTASFPPWEQSITHRHNDLAPLGWTLASSAEVERSGGRSVSKEAHEDYEDLIAHYPGFRFREVESSESEAV